MAHPWLIRITSTAYAVIRMQANQRICRTLVLYYLDY